MARALTLMDWIPGVPTQITLYEQFSGPTAFKPNDLVTLIAGANDIFQGLPVAFAAGTPAQINAAIATLGTTAANSVKADLSQLVAGGAKTILISNHTEPGRYAAIYITKYASAWLGCNANLQSDFECQCSEPRSSE